MEASLTLVAGILLVVGVAGGINIKTQMVTIESPVPQGDRVAATVLGALLIAVAALLEREASDVAVGIAAGAAALAAGAYAVFLWLTRTAS